jgi:arsenate reductase
MAILRVLFVCKHNGARSRIAEEFAKLAASGRIEAFSSSFESEKIGPLPVSVMKEIDVELRTSPPKSVFERFKDKEAFDYVVGICDPDSNEQVPVFLNNLDTLYNKTAQRLNWSIPNFRSLSVKDEERKAKARQIRDRIKTEVLNLLSQLVIDSDLA